MAASFIDRAATISREVYDNLRRAVELGRWPDGRRLSAAQRQTSLQAIIAWETRHLPAEQRSGHIEKPDCATDTDAQQPVNWRHDAALEQNASTVQNTSTEQNRSIKQNKANNRGESDA